MPIAKFILSGKNRLFAYMNDSQQLYIEIEDLECINRQFATLDLEDAKALYIQIGICINQIEDNAQIK